MEIVKNVKKIGSEIEKGVEQGIEKASEVLDNVASHLPFLNLAKTDNGDFHIEIDMPGIKKEDIKVDIDGNLLSVSGTRQMKKEVKKEDYYLCESAFGRIERKFTLPEGVDREKISAELNDGQLVIELQKEEKLKPKSIKIK
ncbi:Hsp20/alpha crystallin family protein [bacterium]|nr:Hsp20/alpha crystallin family protein [bacterium]MBU1958162.1 Hsp20/alpha crystallin family protein [bacterium]